MAHDTLSAIHDVLSQERRALLTGDYGALEGIAQSKISLFKALEADPPNRRVLRELRQRLARNQALTEAALQGIQAAQVRLQALREVRSGLTTYERDGKRAVHKPQAGTIAKQV